MVTYDTIGSFFHCQIRCMFHIFLWYLDTSRLDVSKYQKKIWYITSVFIMNSSRFEFGQVHFSCLGNDLLTLQWLTKQTTKFIFAKFHKNILFQAILRIQRPEGKQCRSRWAVPSWSMLFAYSVIFYLGAADWSGSTLLREAVQIL